MSQNPKARGNPLFSLGAAETSQNIPSSKNIPGFNRVLPEIMERSYSFYNLSANKVKGLAIDKKSIRDASDSIHNSINIASSKSNFKSTIITGTLNNPLISTLPVLRLNATSSLMHSSDNFEDLQKFTEVSIDLQSKEHILRLPKRYRSIPASHTPSLIYSQNSTPSKEFEDILKELEDFEPVPIASESPELTKSTSMKLPRLELDSSPKYQIDFEHPTRTSTPKLPDFIWKKTDSKSAGRLPKLAPVTPDRFFRRNNLPTTRHREIIEFMIPDVSSDLSNKNPLDVINESSEK